MYHMHVGLSTWAATEAALVEVNAALADAGHTVDRFGLALDRAMGVPETERHLAVKETGPRIGPEEWRRLGEAAPIQPHLGDYMIGFPAGFQNTLHALAAGVTTIGNVGQYTAYDLLGGSDEILVTEETVRALAAIGALRRHGALAHSNLEDGSATQASHFGAYVGWAALEMYVVEDLIGARLGTLLRQHDSAPGVPGGRAFRPRRSSWTGFDRLDDLRQHGRSSAGDRAHNTAAVTEQLMCDIALQLRRPTGHAVNPVPLTEAERIPSAAEIVEIHLLAREIEREVRSSPDLHDWAHLEKLGSMVAEYAIEFRDRALAVFDGDGVDVGDAAQVLLALRRTSMARSRAACRSRRTGRHRRPRTVEGVARAQPRRTARRRRTAARRRASGAGRVGGARSGSRHPGAGAAAAGAEVILLGANTPIDGIVRAAIEEDAAAIVLGVYNGNALAARPAVGRRDAQRTLERDDLHGRHPQPGHRTGSPHRRPTRATRPLACTASTT